MPFNSVTFGIFFAVVLPLYWAVPRSARNVVLAVASYTFYGWWDWRFLSLLAISTLVDFTVGLRMAASDDDRIRHRLLLTSASVNLGLLAAFKYFNFFTDSFQSMLSGFGLEADRITLDVILPVGISFYTFQTLSYTFDIYRRRIPATTDFIGFATYVAYFPQLVAGPIERAQHLLPSILDRDRAFPDAQTRGEALRLIVVGLTKKVVLADGVAGIADAAFDDSATASWLMLLAGVMAFAIQIYGDFSGYTDIARGVSRLFGIELTINFTEPYLSRNITEFWRRWHISLSNWLRDYLYISLGGNRHGTARTYRNLMLTMLLGGLWHGASWTFVVWGGLHGFYLVVHKLVAGGRTPRAEPTIRDLPSILLTNGAVLLAWVFFRSDGFGQAWNILAGIATRRPGPVSAADLATVAIFTGLLIFGDLRQRQHARKGSAAATPVARPVLQGAGLGSLLAVLVLFSGGTPVPFIYFQF